MCFLNRLLIIALIILEIGTWMPGVELVGYIPLRFLAAVLGVINAAIRPIVLATPFKTNLLNIAIAAFVINAIAFFLVSYFYLGVRILSLPGGFSSFLLVWVASTIANRWIYIDTRTL